MKALFQDALALKHRYAQHGQYTGTQYALNAARDGCAKLPRKFDWQHDGGPMLAHATFEEAPFTYRVEIRYEDCPDLSWIGDFKDYENDDSVDLEVSDGGRYMLRNGFRYFHPATEYKNLDWRFMKKLLDQEVAPCWFYLTCSKNGIELGSASICGCFYEWGKEDEVAMDYVDDLIYEATEEAEGALETLCPMA